jgi:hypothetical protein
MPTAKLFLHEKCRGWQGKLGPGTNPSVLLRVFLRALMALLAGLALLSFSCLAAFASMTGLQLGVAQSSAEISPGQIASLTFTAANISSLAVHGELKLEQPAGWELIAPPQPVTLKSGESTDIFVSFALPKDAHAGGYTIRASFADSKQEYAPASAGAKITVHPFANVEVSAPLGEFREAAGNEYARVFTVTSLCNAPSRFRASVSCAPEWETRIEPADFTLQPGEAREITVIVQPPADVSKEIPNRIMLTAESLDLSFGLAQGHAASTTVIYPVILRGDMYESLHGQWGVSTSWEDDGDAGAQLYVDAEGELGEGRWGEVFYRGPYFAEWSGLDYLQPDAFRLQYRDDSLGSVLVGDDTFEITPLTELYFGGRGLDAEIYGDGYSLRFFAAKQRNAWAARRIMGLQAATGVAGNTDMKLTVLRDEGTRASHGTGQKPDDGSAISISVKSQPADGVNVEGEVGLGKYDSGRGNGSEGGSGYRMAASFIRDAFSFSGEILRAGNGFPGYWHDSRRISAQASAALSPRVHIWASTGESQHNVSGNPAAASLRTSSGQLGLSFPLGWEWDARLYERWQKHEDENLHSWNVSESATSLDLHRDFKLVDFTSIFELGSKRDLQESTNCDFERVHCIFSARPVPAAFVSGGYRHSADERAAGGRSESDQFWLDANYDLAHSDYLRAGFSATNGAGEGNYNWLRAEYGRKFGDGHSLALRAQQRSGSWGAELSAGVDLSFPLTIPVRWLPKFGRVEGKLYRGESNEPVAGAVIVIDGNKIATAADGSFSFPTLPAGNYELRIERDTLGLALVPDIPEPLLITVKEGGTVRLDVPVVKAAAVKGRVLFVPEGGTGDIAGSISINNLPRGAQPSRLSGTMSMNGVVLVARCGEVEEIQISSPDGNFSFESLRPGQWTVTLADGQVPANYKLFPDQFTFGLEPGTAWEGANFAIIPVAREIIVTAKTE